MSQIFQQQAKAWYFHEDVGPIFISEVTEIPATIVYELSPLFNNHGILYGNNHGYNENVRFHRGSLFDQKVGSLTKSNINRYLTHRLYRPDMITPVFTALLGIFLFKTEP